MMQFSGLLKLAGGLKRKQATLPILAYHRVVDIDVSDYPFDEEIVSASTEMFDQQIAFIKKHFDCCTFADLKNTLDGNFSRTARPVIVTFDDGYADNFCNAFPILKRHGVSATFFVATDYIGTEEPFWWEKIVFWIKRGQIPKTALKDFPSGMNGGGNPSGVINWLKSLNNTVRLDILSAWQQEHSIEQKRVALIQPLNWDEIRTMRDGGMDIGSHTVTHPNLSKLSTADLHRELRASKQKIEKEIGKEVIAIAYPGGKHTDHNTLVRQATEDAGYLFGLAYEGGINSFVQLEKYQLKRIDVERDDSLALFQSNLLFPRLFSYSWKRAQ